MTAAILLTALACSPAQPDAAFREGRELRHDAAAARPKFIAAAKGYDAQWQGGERSAAVAVNRGRAHALAGDLPGAVAAVHAGLRESPYDADLQRDLETLRDEVAYPSGLRPEPLREWRHRVSGWDLFLFTAACVLMVAVGLVRRFTTRDGWAVPAAAVGGFGLLLAAALAWQLDREARRETQQPVLVLTRDVPLRKGNGETYPPQLDWKLPRGAEVRELHRRGGWVQVEAADGTVGWVPEANVIR
jgi:hypothetical protein